MTTARALTRTLARDPRLGAGVAGLAATLLAVLALTYGGHA